MLQEAEEEFTWFAYGQIKQNNNFMVSFVHVALSASKTKSIG